MPTRHPHPYQASSPRPPESDRLKLQVVSFDLDGTLIHPAIFNVVADALGFGAPLQKSYEAYLSGEMTLEEAFNHDFKFFVGRDIAQMRDTLAHSARWTPNIPEALAALKAEGLRVILTTDQPRFLAEHVLTWGFDDLVCTPTTPTPDGRVSDRITPEFEKWPNLKRYLDAADVDAQAVAHVGNGRNDIPVFQRVGLAIAVNAEHADVLAAARHAIPRLEDLRQVVPLLLK